MIARQTHLHRACLDVESVRNMTIRNSPGEFFAIALIVMGLLNHILEIPTATDT